MPMHGILWSRPGWLQKLIWRTVGPSLPTSLEPLAHRQNVACLSLFYRWYFGRCSFELAQLVPLPFSWGRSTHYSDRLHSFPEDNIYIVWNVLLLSNFMEKIEKFWRAVRNQSSKKSNFGPNLTFWACP